MSLEEKLIKVQFNNLVPDQVFDKFQPLEITGNIVRLRVAKNDVRMFLLWFLNVKMF